MNNKLYGKLIFELSHPGRKGYSMPENKFGNYTLPAEMKRSKDAMLPECVIIQILAERTLVLTTASIP